MRVVVSTSQWRTAKVHGKTVRIDSVRPGVLFVDSNDYIYRADGQHGGNSGAFKARRVSDNFETCFAGCAEVLLVAPTQ